MGKKALAFLMSALLLLMVLSAPMEPVGAQIPARTIPAIVSTEWLATYLNTPNLVVLDIRSSDLYNAGHIPGAINVPEASWYANPPFSDAFPWMEMPPTQQLFSLIGNAGITRDSLVVVVGSTSGPLSPIPLALYATAGITRVAITLLYAGIANVAILDGGYDKWVMEGRPTSTAPVTPTPTTYTGVVKSEMVVSKQYVAGKIGSAIIIDARDPEVYLGLVQEPWTARVGHILTARSLPTPWLWSLNLDSSGNAVYITYQSYDYLEALALDVVGSDVTKEVIIYCGVGGYASTLYFVLSEVLGYRNVKVYDGSAQEWSHDKSLPMTSRSPPIVSTEWLYRNLNLPNLVILDIRSSDLYNASHIPGAINVAESEWYDNDPGFAPPSEANWMEMPSAQNLFRLIGNAGITKDSFVVIVGGTSGPLSPVPLALYACAGATRVAMALIYSGISNVSILDGGFDKWAAEGKPVSNVPKTPTPKTYTGTVRSEMLVSKDYVASRIGKAIIIDARNPEVYLGFVQEPWTNKTGHIPTAKSFPTPWLWTVYVDEATGNAKYITYYSEDILHVMASLLVGSDKSKEIIVYCGVGGYASTMYFVLSEVLGYRDVKVYDGSAQEWSFDHSLPIVAEDLGASYMSLSNAYSKLESDFSKLSNDYNSLSDRMTKLEGDFNKLKSDYDKLKSDYSTLKADYDELVSDYDELRSDYEELSKTTTPAYLTFIFVVTTVVFIIAAVYLAMRTRKK